MELITSNLDAIFTVLLASHALALAIVNLTPTPVDNAIVGGVYKVIEVIAGLVTKKSKS